MGKNGFSKVVTADPKPIRKSRKSKGLLKRTILVLVLLFGFES
ncbi:hypothetical protein LEP1GSC199_1213 [Leptospira vanthielii serovar Holland str. Waz Holland = ATCC 700522]|uniref:Uncharacterized protein n=1 Tax=Leptospira vanthielii serovar Holland str. Waz Holland = ATCC 700522 TaxID=1218591 RepID=N1W9X1_9LEPT|nr:hypothetical protein LEP1GSC199_1213 [Leptospira vanthielii serovar Holland str. Waz Holland = ATCC 700522]